MSDALISSQYKALSEVEHVLVRPNTYIGSVANTTQTAFIVDDSTSNISIHKNEELTWNPGLLKLFDEIISNSVDAHIKQNKIKTIKVSVSLLAGSITVEDDGGIPVIEHTEYKIYIPELIFGQLRTGSNFSDDDRKGAGMNGLGAKLTTIFSTKFTVDTCDGNKRFIQTYSDNVSSRTNPLVENANGKKGYTKITFIPDYKRLNCDLDSNFEKIKKRVYDVAGCNPRLKVFFNEQQIKLSSFEEYASLYQENVITDITPNWTVCVAPAIDDTFQHVSFVNGLDTYLGGTHIDYVTSQIVERIREYIKKKHKIDVKPNNIKQQLFMFINCTVNAPMFTSQTKEFLSSDPKTYETEYKPSDKFINKIIESPVIERVLNWAEAEQRREELAELKKLNKQTQKTNFLKRIAKFDDASTTDRSKATIFFTEGDSAAKAILSSRDPKLHGVFPLRGKMLNVRDVSIRVIAANDEFQNIMGILGLRIGHEPVKEELRFGKIIIASDADLDGFHIRGLFLNMINEFWPSLIKDGYIHYLKTPLIVATKGKQLIEFFDTKEFEKTNTNGWVIKYNKGLGGWSSKDFKKFLFEPQYIDVLSYVDEKDTAALDIAFDKKKADARKLWLVER